MAAAIHAFARLQGHSLDRLRLHHAMSLERDAAFEVSEKSWQLHLQKVALQIGATSVEWSEQPDPARMPAISCVDEWGWVTVRGQTPAGDWLVEHQGQMRTWSAARALPVGRLIFPQAVKSQKSQPVRQLFTQAFWSHKSILVEGALAGILINVLALATSLYSMQVYDRVIPAQGYSTLLVLTLGVALSMGFELVFKLVRSYLMDHAVMSIDRGLSREIFSRLLSIRLDQLPGTVGSLSAQLRGYETIRAFLSSSTFYVLVDVPFGLVFVIMIALIGSPLVAMVPLFFLMLSFGVGSLMRKKVEHHARQATAAANLKTGLLVEAIEGAETLKAGGGGWGALSRWIDVVDESIQHDAVTRGISEKTGYMTALLQQASYVGLVAIGAYLAAEGQLTMGALIACSILSGRALGPIAQLPGLMTQRAHAKAALAGLEKLYAMQIDNHDVDRPLTPEVLSGRYALERVRFAYPGAPKALAIAELKIQPGEKIGVLGPIGSGKSTLLRLLTGMYQANEGRILLDGLDIDQIGRDVLADRLGYLQQEHRLFSGTLRQNLLIGIPDPGDDAIRDAAARTGLLAAITHHPKGLELMIAEGGKGLSGGQRQLVALTRLLLSQPDIWLLDEPTASMDEQTEQRCIQVLREAIKPQQTLVLVTHKPALLSMVNRIVVVSGHQMTQDGPKDQILAKLRERGRAQQAAVRGTPDLPVQNSVVRGVI